TTAARTTRRSCGRSPTRSCGRSRSCPARSTSTGTPARSRRRWPASRCAGPRTTTTEATTETTTETARAQDRAAGPGGPAGRAEFGAVHGATGLEAALWRAVAAYRGLALCYAAVMIAVNSGGYARPAGGWAVLGVMTAWTAYAYRA